MSVELFPESELVNYKDRSQWIDGRACSIGSSDSATIVGMGYSGSTRYTLWREKAYGIRKEWSEDDLKRFAKGHAAEPYIAKCLEIDQGWKIEFDPPYSYRRNKLTPWLTASLDSYSFIDGEYCPIEFKNVSRWAAFDWDVKQGSAPLKYTIQLQHQFLVTGAKRGYLVALEGFDTKPILVERDDRFLAALMIEYKDFWRHVIEKIEPNVDDSEATFYAVCAQHPSTPKLTTELSEETTHQVDDILRCSREIEELESRRQQTLNRLVQSVGPAEYLRTTGGLWYSFKPHSSRAKKRTLKLYKGKIEAKYV
jgi:putative phage-type endonuclease